MTLSAIIHTFANNVFLLSINLYILKTANKISKFINHFKTKNRFTVDDALRYFKENEADISRNAVILRLNKWVNKSYISRIGKGSYTTVQKMQYRPYIDENIKQIYAQLHKQFPYTRFCIWNNKVFNEFMVHQPGRFYTLAETEKDASEYVFNFLKSNNYEVFLNPDETITNLYTVFTKNCIIVKDLITEAPLHTVDKVPTYTLEKILTDAFCDTHIFAAQQETELENIFTGAFEKYRINTKKMMRYADRRNRKNEITEYLNSLNIKI